MHVKFHPVYLIN